MWIISTVQEGNFGLGHETIKTNVWRGKETNYIYLYVPVPQFREAESRLKLSSCLHGAIINSAPRIENYINKKELYIQFPEKYWKTQTLMKSRIMHMWKKVMTVTPILKI